MRLLALTDHDDTGGLAEAREAAEELGLVLVNGVEISVTWGGQTVHVVGLRIEPSCPVLSDGLARLREGRRLRAQAIAEALERAGIPGALEGARARAVNPELVGRTHFARFMVDEGHARDVSSVFQKYLASGKPGYVPHRWASLAEAIGWIAASGGVAVLAHPGRYRLTEAQRETLFAEFRDLGGRAVEVVTGSHAPEQFAVYARYARRYGLLASAGSDFHAPGESRCDLGELPELPAGCEPIWAQW